MSTIELDRPRATAAVPRAAHEAHTASAAVRARQVSKRFGANVILDRLDLDIGPGQFVALLGRSGSGKTTLLRALAGLDVISSGTLNVPSARAAVFQEPRLMPWKRAWRNVTLGLDIAQPRERAKLALQEVGLAHRENAWPATLSGGEAQRVALARALVREPQLLLLDEPFAALDALTRIRMHQLILDLWRQHKPSVLLVTHDVDEAVLLADRVLVLDQGRIAADIAIAQPRPRSAQQPQFQQVRARLLGLLGVELESLELPAPVVEVPVVAPLASPFNFSNFSV